MVPSGCARQPVLHLASYVAISARAVATFMQRRRGSQHRVEPARPGRAVCRHGARARDGIQLLFMTKGGGSANKSFLFQETKAILSPDALMDWLDARLRALGTAACPPYHLAIVIGGTSAEFALKTAKYASARYLDTLPTEGSLAGDAIRDPELEERVKADPRVRDRCPVRRQVLWPRRPGGATGPPRGVAAGGDRGLLLGRPAGAGQDHP